MLKSTEVYSAEDGAFTESIDLPEPLLNHCLGLIYNTNTNRTDVILTGIYMYQIDKKSNSTILKSH